VRYNTHQFDETKITRGGNQMIQQTLMPIKLERMEPKHTARSGLFLYAEFMKGFGVDRLILEHMPIPKSGRGYDPCTFIKHLSMTLY